MKIAFNKKIVTGPWGGGNQMLLLMSNYLKERGHEVVFSLNDLPSAVVIMDSSEPSCSFPFDELLKYKLSTKCKVIHRVNDNGSHRKNSPQRNDRTMIRINKKFADETIFISQWLKDYYKDRGLSPSNSHVVVNGVNRNNFYPIKKDSIKPPLKIVTHHWSSNPSKGFQTYELLANFCRNNPHIASFNFIGNKPAKVLNKGEWTNPQPYEKIPQHLRKYDIYVTATQFESGGCHLVEGMACGLIPLVKEGGGGPEEYSNGYGYIYKNTQDLISKIQNLYDKRTLFLQKRNDIVNNYTYSSNDMCQQYMEIIK